MSWNTKKSVLNDLHVIAQVSSFNDICPHGSNLYFTKHILCDVTLSSIRPLPSIKIGMNKEYLISLVILFPSSFSQERYVSHLFSYQDLIGLVVCSLPHKQTPACAGVCCEGPMF